MKSWIVVLFLYSLSVLAQESWVAFNDPSELSTSTSVLDKVLVDIPDNATVLGLGEVIHGAEVPHLLRIELIKSLIQKKNYRVFALETSWYLAERLNEIIADQNSNPECEPRPEWVAFSGFTAWQTPALNKNLFSWICKWNRNHPDDLVSFTGFDIQMSRAFDLRYASAEPYAPTTDMLEVGTVFQLDRIAKKYFGSEQIGIREKCFDESFLIPRELGYRARKDGMKFIVECEAELNRLKELIKSIPIDFLGLQEKQALFAYDLSLSFLKTKILFPANRVLGYKSRDTGMAKMIEWSVLNQHPGKKVILYAHNDHLRKLNKTRPMGVILKDIFQERYFVIGSMGYEILPNFGLHLYSEEQKTGFLEDYLFRNVKAPFAYLGSHSELLAQEFYQNDSAEYEGVKTEDFKAIEKTRFDAILFYKISQRMEFLAPPVPFCHSLTEEERNGELMRSSQGEGCKNSLFIRSNFFEQATGNSAWLDSMGVIWSETLKKDSELLSMTEKEASDYCSEIGAQLPDRQDIIRLREYMGSAYGRSRGYYQQVFSPVDSGLIWIRSSTEMFNLVTGEIIPKSAAKSFLRCIKKTVDI